MHIVKSGKLMFRQKDKKKQVREEIYQKLLQSFQEYITPRSEAGMKRKLEKTSKDLTEIVLKVKKETRKFPGMKSEY
jgi:hypothetical protein